VALRVNVPMLPLAVHSSWVPSAAPIPWVGVSYESYAGVVSLLSWVAVPLFLASISGLVKRDK
jgi:hypothetical protein